MLPGPSLGNTDGIVLVQLLWGGQRLLCPCCYCPRTEGGPSKQGLVLSAPTKKGDVGVSRNAVCVMWLFHPPLMPPALLAHLQSRGAWEGEDTSFPLAYRRQRLPFPPGL